MLVVARPVNRSGWKLSVVVAAGAGAEPADTDVVPGPPASAAGIVICEMQNERIRIHVIGASTGLIHFL